MKNMKRGFAQISIIVILAVVFQIKVGAASIIGFETTDKRLLRFQEVCDMKIKTFEDTARQISAEKQLLDFDGNRYWCVELEPTGYMIFHESSGQFVEWAENSPSPYMGIWITDLLIPQSYLF